MQRGYGREIMAQVDPVVAWHNQLSDRDRERLENSIAAMPVDDNIRTLWEQFKEMWIDSDYAERRRAQLIATSGDIGVLACVAGAARGSDLYQLWKSGLTVDQAEEQPRDPCSVQ